MVKIVFTHHARMRMRERNISVKEVTDCVLYPDSIFKEGVQIRRFQKSVSYGTLEVVGRYKESYLIVITTYPL
jgi:hypothetical protein